MWFDLSVWLVCVSVPSRGAIFLNANGGNYRNKSLAFPSPLGELYFLIPSLGPRLFSGGIYRFAWQIVFSGNIAFFGMNFCRFSQCLCSAWETPAKLPDFCFFDSFGFYDSFGCNVISHCPIMYSFP